ncbi:MAG: peptidase domain-containing ABC transporter [Cyanobium sp.]
MATTTRIDELLRCFPFLADQPEDLLQRLSAEAQLQRFDQGQPICRVDHPPARIFFLLEGTARSVVFSSRLPRGVSTLERLQPGTVLGWTLLSCGRCWETLIASTDLVVVAIPHESLQREMERHPALAERVRRSVSPAELFGVLDAHLQDYPRVLSQEVVEAANGLAESTVAYTWMPAEPAAFADITERLWLVAAGPLPLGQAVVGTESTASQDPIRVLGIDRQRLATILEPPAPDQAEQGGNGWHARLLARWEQQRQSLEPAAIAAAAPINLNAPTQAVEQDRRGPDAFPWVRGVGPLESPIAAFQMLSQHLNLPFRREMMRRVFGDQVQRHGEASLPLAGAVAESMGLQTQLLDIQAGALPRLTPPLMIRWGNGLAVIWRCTTRSVLVGIPAVGNQEISLADFRDQWGEAGDVLTLRVNDQTPRRRFGFRWFLPALQQHRTVLLEVLLASFFVQLFGLVNPLLIQQVIDKVIINNSPSALGVLGVLLVVFALFEGLLLCLRTFLFVDTTNRIDLSLGTQIIDHLLRLPLSYFDRRSVGEVSSRIGELEKVRGFLTGTALTTILDVIFSVLYIGVMLIYSWQLTLLTLAVVPFLVLLVLVVSPIVQLQLQSRAVAHARTQSHLVEVLSSMMTVKAQNIELRSRWKWQDLYTDYVADGFDNTLVGTTASSISGFLNKLSGLIVIWAGAGMVLSGSLSLGELIAFRIIAGYVTGPLLRMTSIWQSVQETALSLERLSDVIDHPQEAPEGNATRLIMPPIQGEICFRNISFRYKPSSPLLLKNLNLTIPRGTFVAIVGTSGSGKSTLTKLLARLYSPEEGVVLVDGIDVAKVELYSLRRQLGIVPQDTVLFDGSVEENITLTNPDASTEEVIEAARIAAAHDFIMELPAGYSTEVGERGSSLSGGQRQRIAIARTILQKPRLLIMDEATSALDYQTERVVSENLMQALQGCSVLFITHRLSSIVKADMIVCMGQGSVLEVGSHDELMQARGPYYALFRQQGRSSSSNFPDPVSASVAAVPTAGAGPVIAAAATPS